MAQSATIDEVGFESSAGTAAGSSSPHISPEGLSNRRKPYWEGDPWHYGDGLTYDDWTAEVDRLREQANPNLYPKSYHIPKVVLARGGYLAQLKRWQPCRPYGGGERGEITSFSAGSRFRLFKFINRLDYTTIPDGSVWFTTLTYPGVWQNDPKLWKKHIDNFGKRLRRAWGKLPCIWKMEPQKRGAPHFHFMMFMPEEMCRGMKACGKRWHNNRMATRWKGGKFQEFIAWVSRAWYEVVGSGDEKHLAAGTSVEVIESRHGVNAYVGKYFEKTASFIDKSTGEVLKVGRFWGAWNRDMFQRHEVSVFVPERAAHQIRRVLRRLTHGKDRPENMVEWLPWYGQPRSWTRLVPWPTMRKIIECFAPGAFDRGGTHYAKEDRRQREALVNTPPPTPGELADFYYSQYLIEQAEEHENIQISREWH